MENKEIKKNEVEEQVVEIPEENLEEVTGGTDTIRCTEGIELENRVNPKHPGAWNARKR